MTEEKKKRGRKAGQTYPNGYAKKKPVEQPEAKPVEVAGVN